MRGVRAFRRRCRPEPWMGCRSLLVRLWRGPPRGGCRRSGRRRASGTPWRQYMPGFVCARFWLETGSENGSILGRVFVRILMKIFNREFEWRFSGFSCQGILACAGTFATRCGVLLVAGAQLVFGGVILRGQQSEGAKPVVVQPGAPGQPSRTLPASTRGVLPARSQADVEFMQGMIMHHAQAVEMTALMESHTENKELRSLGARISSSQSDEIRFMKRWLAARGESLSMATQGMPGMDMSKDISKTGTTGDAMALMPGMLTP